MKTHKFARKPFYVDALRVSESNIKEVAEWCGGEICTENGTTFVKVDVFRPLTDRQTQAFIGDWVLDAGTGFKVYTPKAFDKSFEKVRQLTKEQADAAGIKPPHEPRATSVSEAFKRAEENKKNKKGPVPTPPKQVQVTQKGSSVTATVPVAEKVEWDIDANRPMEETRRLEEAVAEQLTDEVVADTGSLEEQQAAAADALIREVLEHPVERN